MQSRLLRLLVPIALLAAFSFKSTPSIHAGQAASRPLRAPSAAQLLEQRLEVPIPYRNLFTLAAELKHERLGSVPHVVRRTSPNYRVGHQDSFNVLSEDENKFFIMHATIRVETPHLYLYVQNGVHVAQSALNAAAQKFEHSTYPTDRSYFGSEWTPGIDGDPHITCLVGDLKSTSTGTAGFFSAEDEYPKSVNPYSNQREMFYINSANTPPGSTEFDLTLAHEFQHMIHWHMHPHEELWLNEGMSILAQVLNKYTDDGMADSFIGQPHTQLNTWNEVSPYSHYGAAYLFLSYLYDHYGRTVIRKILADNRYTDFPVIDDVLHQLHIPVSAHEVFQRWVIANLIDNASIANGVYAYKALQHTVSAPAARSLPLTYTGKLPPYTADYVNLDTSSVKGPIHLHFAAPLTIPMVSGGGTRSFWYANRGDMSDPSMQRTFDLTRVHHATLHFDTWYDVEQDYDYAYVEASTDGGKTWTPLHATHSTLSNPNGASYGYAYTGASTVWRSESADLSKFTRTSGTDQVRVRHRRRLHRRRIRRQRHIYPGDTLPRQPDGMA